MQMQWKLNMDISPGLELLSVQPWRAATVTPTHP